MEKPARSKKVSPWKRFIDEMLAQELNSIAPYFDVLTQLDPLPHDPGTIFDKIQCSEKRVVITDHFTGHFADANKNGLFFINGNFNYSLDIQGFLDKLKSHITRGSRLIVISYNPYLQWAFRLANLLGLRNAPLPQTFLTKQDLCDLGKLSGFELISTRPAVYFPFRLFGLGTILNLLIVALPYVRWLSLTTLSILRPLIPTKAPTLTIVIPARNEKGTIEKAVTTLPDFGPQTEIVFVEGHSNDGTWEEILRIQHKYRHRLSIKALKQDGIGKANAVNLGCEAATNELIAILDADLSVSTTDLVRFYNAYQSGIADFINGSRLLYPLEKKAMRPLNLIGNIFFARLLSVILDIRLTDSLCGTKVFNQHDYQRMKAWRADFRTTDPFGDFELLIPAAILGIGIVNVPIFYRDRVYGSTQIHRFRHGLLLLKMCLITFKKVFVRRSHSRPNNNGEFSL